MNNENKADTRLGDILLEVTDELRRAMAIVNNKPFDTYHYGYAVLLEEVDELWDEIKQSKGRNTSEEIKKKIRKEAIQVGAMAIRFLYDLCEE